MEKEFCILNENGEVFGLTNPQEAFGSLEIYENIEMYRINCFYQRMHNDIIGLINKGFILPSYLVYPRQEIQNTINFLGDVITSNVGEYALKELQAEINEQLEDTELISDLMHNIMVNFNFELHPHVISSIKRGDL